METIKAISVTGENGNFDLGYYMGENSNIFEDNCGVDPCDWGDEAESKCKKLNELFDEEGWDLFASVETFPAK